MRDDIGMKMLFSFITLFSWKWARISLNLSML